MSARERVEVLLGIPKVKVVGPIGTAAMGRLAQPPAWCVVPRALGVAVKPSAPARSAALATLRSRIEESLRNRLQLKCLWGGVRRWRQ